MKNEITDYLSKQPDIVLAYLFGSVARGQADSMSDVDIAVLLEPDLTGEAALERQLELMLALDDFSEREVQVTLLNQAPPVLAFQVIREGLLLYERSRLDKINFEVLVMKRYADLKPMLQFFKQTLFKQIREEGLGRRKRRSGRTLEAAQRIQERLTGTTKRA